MSFATFYSATVILECDNDCQSVFSHQSITDETAKGVEQHAREIGWKMGKNTYCPDCSGKIVKPQFRAKQIYYRQLQTLKTQGFRIHHLHDTNCGVQLDHHCDLCANQEPLFSLPAKQPYTYTCTKHLKTSDFIDTGESVFRVGSDEWFEFISKAGPKPQEIG